MNGANADIAQETLPPDRARWRRKRVLVPVTVVALLIAALAAAWFSRESIAENIIQSQLRSNGLSASYDIASIGAERQVLRNLVIGDPARPDLTAEEVDVRIRYRFGTPALGQVTLVKPRLYGRLVGGRVSFGTLDKLLYSDTGTSSGLPDIDLVIRDGRALVRTDYGPVGIKLDGAGPISDGFAGVAAVSAPALAFGGCRVSGSSLFGKITTSAGEPQFTGPLRLAALNCPAQGIALGSSTATLDISADKALAALSGQITLAAETMRYGAYRAGGADMTLRGKWKDGLLDERHTLALRGVTTPQASAALVTLEGSLRASDSFTRVDFRSDLEGNGLRPGPALTNALDTLASAGADTLLAPLARRFAAALGRQARGSSLAGDIAARRSGGVTSVMIPQAVMQGGGGARVLSLSRVEASFGGEGPARLSGNIATGGPDMPRITGRMERGADGDAVFRLAMQPYSADGSTLAIPQMNIIQASDGALGFAGQVKASGPLPGGMARGLAVPVSGRWSPGGELSLWRQCTTINFDRLELANLALEKRSLTLCPATGRAIVENGAGGLRIAAGAPSLDLAGTLGETPIRLSSGPVGFAWPGVMTARSVAVSLGPVATASRFTISDLTAKLGGSDIAGRFDGADVRLASVPLDLRDASGDWRYAGGAFTLGNGDFRLVDRQADARFLPQVARDADLRLQENIITADALLRNPETGRVVTEVALRHDLSRGSGHADLTVPGLVFDDKLQPLQLSQRAKGVIANASGTVTGTGRIDWASDGTVTSSGDFSSDSLDFAAAFGPVKGASGTVHFTDLIGLTTAPGQTLTVASVNPGIEVTDGEVTFQLSKGQLLSVEEGSWPFMGGRLILKSVDLNFGVQEARRYEFQIVGLDAAAFVSHFQLPNISATGIFDGSIPIVFDENGNGTIQGGKLSSRPPGGNVSYVGDLTYKDLSAIANFAFGALRSLDYNHMDIALNGSLTGEIVTNVRFEGVKQGEGAKRNIITRAIAGLPIEFRINIRAPFYQLISNFRSLHDPAAVRDPRDVRLLSADGTRLLTTEVRGEDIVPEVTPEDIIPEQPPVQN